MDIPAGQAVDVEAPWGINPANGRPYTKSPEERAAIGAQLAEARKRKAQARHAEVVEATPAPEQLAPIDRSAEDREPGAERPRRRAGRRRAGRPDAKPVDVPPFRAGPIAKGMNRLYAKAGRLIKALGYSAFGEVIISITRKESDDDETVGEAWEALAQVSPAWRARLLKLVTGGAAGRVLMAHLPIVLALLMLDPVKRRMPFGGLVDAVFGDDEPAAGPPTDVPGADWEQMMAMATQMMGPLVMQRAANGGAPRMPTPEDYQPGGDLFVPGDGAAA